VREVCATGRVGTWWIGKVILKSERMHCVSSGGHYQHGGWSELTGARFPTLIVLREMVTPPVGEDEFSTALIEQLRVLRLVAVPAQSGGVLTYEYRVEVWAAAEPAFGRSSGAATKLDGFYSNRGGVEIGQAVAGDSICVSWFKAFIAGSG